MSKSAPCAQCPWRKSNHGKPHKFGFYTKANLRRLWNQIRGGGKPQSCHLTDPSHPDHGAKPSAKAQECPGAVIIVLREVGKMADDKKLINSDGVSRYLRERKKFGLKKSGVLYWVVERIQMAGVPFLGGEKLPEVNDDDPEIGLPEEFEVG